MGQPGHKPAFIQSPSMTGSGFTQHAITPALRNNTTKTIESLNTPLSVMDKTTKQGKQGNRRLKHILNQLTNKLL